MTRRMPTKALLNTAPTNRSRSRLRPAAAALLAATLVIGALLCILAVAGPANLFATTTNKQALTVEPKHPSCGYSAKLVPNCGRWWGVAPMALTRQPLQIALPKEERFAGRRMDIVHAYHTNGQLFPTAAERAVARAPGANRLLLLNWKPATDLSWRQVAQGAADARIDRLAAHIRSTFRQRFFLAIYHEPEDNVRQVPGSGYRAEDYAAMFRHVVARLRADKVTWAVTVMNYMGFVNWTARSWFPKLWPGNAYVDWIGIDPYGTGAAKTSYTANTFSTLINRTGGSFPGFYTWATKTHPGKPMMLAEWGVGSAKGSYGGQARFFDNVAASLKDYPMLKALVYFDIPAPPPDGIYTYLAAENSSSLTAYRRLVHTPSLVGPTVRY